MSIGINSFSSQLMLNVTAYRNQPSTFNKIAGQGGYALIAVVAFAETITAVAFSALSRIASVFSATEHSSKWLESASFTFGWAVTDFFLNPFVSRLVADERSARLIYQSGDLMTIPDGAII